MKNFNFKTLALSAVILFAGVFTQAQTNIVEGAVASDAHTTLVAAVKAADLVETLASEGPFTVFAPTNAAFEALPEGTVATLLKPENKATLQKVLTYHVIAGDFKAADVINIISDTKNGEAMVKTVAGESLTLSLKDGKVMITDVNGNTATVTAADLNQTNGVIHVVDTVLLPKM